MTQTHRVAKILKNDLGVKESYQHASKRVTHGEPIETNGAALKWYALHPEDRQVPDEIASTTVAAQ
jgi:hypothetical protein